MYAYACEMVGGWGPLTSFWMEVGLQTSVGIIRRLELSAPPLGRADGLEMKLITNGQ